MSDIRVSICIPTYNRCDYLRKTIVSIIKDPAFQRRDLEIVISDNASTDETEKICREVQNKYQNIIYHRNKDNIRDYNFLKTIKMSNGNLRKLWNDSMIMKDGVGDFLCDIEGKYRDKMPALFFENSKCKFYEQRDTGVIPFNSLINLASYRITWNGAFAVWAKRVDELSENGAELCLWVVRQFCELAADKGGVYIKHAFADGKAVKGKDISYGVHKVFYTNLVDKIMHDYKQRGILTQDTWDFFRRDLLFGFFTSSLMQWEAWKNGDKTLIFSETENLPELIHAEFCNDDYYNDFLQWYKVRKAKEQGNQIKYLANKIKYKLGIR